MKIDGEHAFEVPRETVWSALTDPQVLANSVPGLRQIESIGPQDYRIVVKAGIGGVTGTYDGLFSFADAEVPEFCTIRAELGGPPGSVRTVAQMRLHEPAEGRTILTYEADATVTGALAGVGQRLVAAAARRTTDQFLEAVEAEMACPRPQPEDAEEHRRAVFAPTPRDNQAADRLTILISGAVGFALALIAVAIGRWTAPR